MGNKLTGDMGNMLIWGHAQENCITHGTTTTVCGARNERPIHHQRTVRTVRHLTLDRPQVDRPLRAVRIGGVGRAQQFIRPRSRDEKVNV